MGESPPERASTDMERSPKVNDAAVSNPMALDGAFTGEEPDFT
jgi:hypothetical protein